MFLLDTDHISILQLKTQPACHRITRRMGQHAPSLFFRSIISFQEQAFGAHAYVNRLRTQGVRIATQDLRIAATALARSLVVLTANTRDFAKVPGLKIEDWTK